MWKRSGNVRFFSNALRALRLELLLRSSVQLWCDLVYCLLPSRGEICLYDSATRQIVSKRVAASMGGILRDLGAFQDLHLYLQARMVVVDLPMLKFETCVFRHIYLPPDIE